MAINVFIWNNGDALHQLSQQPLYMPRITLMLIEKTRNFHYTWIKNFNRPLYDQSKHQEHKHVHEKCILGSQGKTS